MSKRLVKAARAVAPAIMTNAQTQAVSISAEAKKCLESGHESLALSKKVEVMEPNDCVRLGQLGWQCASWKILASVYSRSMDQMSGSASWVLKALARAMDRFLAAPAHYSCALPDVMTFSALRNCWRVEQSLRKYTSNLPASSRHSWQRSRCSSRDLIGFGFSRPRR